MRCDSCLTTIRRHSAEIFLSFGTIVFGFAGCGRRYFCGFPCLFRWIVQTLPLEMGAALIAEIREAKQPGGKWMRLPPSPGETRNDRSNPPRFRPVRKQQEDDRERTPVDPITTDDLPPRSRGAFRAPAPAMHRRNRRR